MIIAPDELRIEPNNLGTPVVSAAFGPTGILVAAGQQGIRHALAYYGPDLTEPRVRVLAADEKADWDLVRVVPLPDGRFLMCNRERSPNLYVDAGTLETEPAEGNARDAFVLGGRLIIGHHSTFANFVGYEDFTGWDGQPWLHDLADRMHQHTGTSAWRWVVHAGAVVGDVLVLAGMTHLRSGTYDHQLVLVDAGAIVRRVVPIAKEVIRDPALVLVADRGRLLVSGAGRLLVFDAALDEVASEPVKDPFRLLAGDGNGRLLWYEPKGHRLVVAERNELPTEPIKTPKRKPASKIERHLIDTAIFHADMPGARQRLLDLLAGPPPAQLWPLPGLAHDVFVRASIFEREDPILSTAIRALAQSRTGRLLARRAYAAGQPTVDVPFGDGTATVESIIRSGSASSLDWRDAWYAALIARDERCLDLLDGFADGEIEHGLKHGDAWRAALRTYRSRPAATGPAVDAAVAAAAPEQFQSTFQHRMHAPHTAIYPALARLAEDDAAGFTNALVDALKVHRTFFGSKSQSRNSLGWVALGPLALCCLAHDRGITLNVRSDYLLPYLIVNGPGE